jgi:hypothetical protein
VDGGPVNAADVLAEDWQRHYTIDAGWAGTLVAALLAHGEQGEHRGGIYIDPDGGMWRVRLIGEDLSGHSIVVLLPLSAEAGDTDG